jgi:hypothetical protein
LIPHQTFLDVSDGTIGHRAIPWQDDAAPGKLRSKKLKLGKNTRKERSYFRYDLEKLLVV